MSIRFAGTALQASGLFVGLMKRSHVSGQMIMLRLFGLLQHSLLRYFGNRQRKAECCFCRFGVIQHKCSSMMHHAPARLQRKIASYKKQIVEFEQKITKVAQDSEMVSTMLNTIIAEHIMEDDDV